MIILIHGTDSYLSYKYLLQKKEEYTKRGYEIKTINVDDDFEVTDPTILYAALSEQDLFGSAKALILKRIASADLFYKLGKPLKSSTKLFENIKNSPSEVIIWEDKNITQANPLYKLAKEVKAFTSPFRDYEVSGYVQQNFKNIDPEVKKIILGNIKSTDTNEIATEINKLISTPKEFLRSGNLVLSQNTPSWIISDAISAYIAIPNDMNLQKLFKALDSVDEDIRYKLAIIQNHISEMIYVKRAKTKNDKSLQEKVFSGKRSFVFQKIERLIGNVKLATIVDYYKKSLIVEYYLNNGLISENVALQTIFIGDIKSMSLELISD